MESSEVTKKPSKAARLRAARERAAKYAQRDKESLEKQKAKKSAPVASEEKTNTTATKTKSVDKTMSNAERKRLAKENAKEFGARDMAKLESKKKSASAATVEPKKQQKTKQSRRSSTKQRKPALESPAATTADSPIALAATTSDIISPQQAVAPSIAPMEVVEQAQLQANDPLNVQHQNALQNAQNYQAEISVQQAIQKAPEHHMHTQQMQVYALRQQQQAEREAVLQQGEEALLQQMLRHQQQQRQQQELNQATTLRTFQQSAAGLKQEQLPAAQIGKTVLLSEPVARQAIIENSYSPPLPSARSNANIVIKEEEMDKDDTCPPPTEPLTQAQVSQLVLSNAQKDLENTDHSSAEEDNEGVRSELVDGAVKIEEYSESIHIADENEKELETTKQKSKWRQVSVAILIAALAVVFIQVSPGLSTEESLSPDNDLMVPEEALCYLNSDSELEETCLDGSSSALCPKGGLCQGGKLVGCENMFQDVSDQEDKCVLTEEYIPMKVAIMDQLVSHASQICDQSSKPKFKYAMLQAGQSSIPEDETQDLIEVLIDEGFIVDERESLYVGLPEGFKTNLPFYCTLGNVVQWFLEKIGLLILGLFGSAFSFAWAYKKLSFIFGILLFCGQKYRNHLASKARRQKDIKRTRELAYQTLEDSPGVEHWAIHIRDEIALALYPDSKKLRLELQKRVWPKIVDDLKRDTRIRKCQKVNEDGKVWDKWQWTAAAKTPSQS